MYVTKVNILVNVFDCRDDSDCLIIIVRIKEFYFCNVSSIRIVVFRNFCRTRKFDKFNKSRSNTNFIYKILQNILLLFRKIDVLSNCIKYNNK